MRVQRADHVAAAVDVEDHPTLGRIRGHDPLRRHPVRIDRFDPDIVWNGLRHRLESGANLLNPGIL
jgi:hypothetical protein